MPVKISLLPAVTSSQLTAVVPVVQAGATMKATVQQLLQAGAPYTVTNVTAVKALAGAQLTGVVTTQGYTTAGDGGAGSYWWNSTDTTADNGGTVIAPNSGGTGRWNLILQNGFFNVRQFGAKGDGTTNDYASLSATAAACTNVGGVIIFPSGNYKIGTALSFASNVALAFSPGAILVPSASVTITINGLIEAQRQRIFNVSAATSLIDGFGLIAELLPEWWGAVADGTTDCEPAFTAALASGAAASNAAQRVIRCGVGTYSLGAGITVNGNGVRLIGASSYETTLKSGGSGLNLITFGSGLECSLENLRVYDAYLETANYLVSLNGSVECKITDCMLIGGWVGLYAYNNSADSIVTRTKIYAAYQVQAYLHNCQTIYFRRCKIDNAWPVSTPTSAQITGAWAASTAYSVGDVVTQSGYWLQCKTAGTSASAAPTVLAYNTNITDGAVVWLNAGSSTSSGMQIDGAVYNINLEDCDLTGAYNNGLYLATSGGHAPQKTVIRNLASGGFVSYGIYAQYGAGLFVAQSNIGAAIGSGTPYGIRTAPTFTGDAVISDTLVASIPNGTGISIGGGTNTIIKGCTIAGCPTAISVDAGVTQFVIADNACGASATWGTNAAAIVVATGASDYYNIVNNVVHGATSSGVTDGGTGTHKTVSGNV